MLHGNYVDLIILLILVFFIHQGFVHGFWAILVDFISFLGSLIFSLYFYKFVAEFLKSNFSLNLPLANSIGFLISAISIQILLSFLVTKIIKKLPPKILTNKMTKILGTILSLIQGLVIIAFAINLAISLPISPKIKTDITNSKIGQIILDKTKNLDFPLKVPISYLTIEPQSHESIPLDVGSLNLKVDDKSETQMFNLVNYERQSRGIKVLVWENSLLTVARDYASFMWKNNYFGHYDSSGKDVGDRLQAAGINYQIAGENLALAPTVDIAHTGLMNSPGHRANILETKFKKVAIGVIDNGFYGKIFVQVFTN